MIESYNEEWMPVDKVKNKALSQAEIDILTSEVDIDYSDSEGWKRFINVCYGL